VALRWVLCAVAVLASSEAPQGPLELSPAVRDEFVAAHNRWRSQAGVEPMRWSSDLAESAQSWASALARKGCRLKHSSTNDLGENLYLRERRGGGRLGLFEHATPTEIIDAWGKESNYFSYARNRCAAGQSCGHYTQIVWRETRDVGCAVSVCPDSTQIGVCQYWPAGNVVGRRPY
jgi:pathogenesis-related protein 1